LAAQEAPVVRPNMPLNLTKSPLRWPEVEWCLTGAFAG